jgi:hypothetical protein
MHGPIPVTSAFRQRSRRGGFAGGLHVRGDRPGLAETLRCEIDLGQLGSFLEEFRHRGGTFLRQTEIHRGSALRIGMSGDLHIGVRNCASTMATFSSADWASGRGCALPVSKSTSPSSRMVTLCAVFLAQANLLAAAQARRERVRRQATPAQSDRLRPSEISALVQVRCQTRSEQWPPQSPEACAFYLSQPAGDEVPGIAYQEDEP